jgi:hypothetical protein
MPSASASASAFQSCDLLAHTKLSSNSVGMGARAGLSPALLACKTLVEKGEDLADIELDIFEVEILLVVFLHLQEIVKFQVQLQQSTVAS